MKKNVNTVWHNATVTRAHRQGLNGHRSVVLWFTGLSGSGKSTLLKCINGNIKANLSSTITGGTGRFINATGTFTIKANGNINVQEGKNTFNGTISY